EKYVVDAQIDVAFAQGVGLLLDLEDQRQQSRLDVAGSDVHSVDVSKHARELGFIRWRRDSWVHDRDLRSSTQRVCKLLYTRGHALRFQLRHNLIFDAIETPIAVNALFVDCFR